MIRSLLVLVVVASTVPAAAAPIVDDPTREPYMIDLGTQGHWDRADNLARLAADAERAGDPARAARFFAIACYARSVSLFDATLGTAECKRAGELATRHDLADVDVALGYAKGNVQAWQLDIAGSVATLRAAIARGSSIPFDSPLGMPVRAARFTLGAIILEGGMYDLALAELAAVRTAAIAAHDGAMMGWSELWQCRAYTRLGEYARARERCTSVRGQVERAHDWALQVMLEWIESDLEAVLERHPQALERLTVAWQLCQARGCEVFHPTLILDTIGEDLALGKVDEAAAWQAKLDGMPKPPNYLTQAAMARGMIALQRSELPAAVTAFEHALASPMHVVAISARYRLSTTRTAMGNVAGARAALEDAIRRIESDRAAVGPDQRATFMALHALAYRSLIGLLWDEHPPDVAARALEVAEAGRARALLDAVAMTKATSSVAPVRSAAEIIGDLAPGVVLIEYAVTADRAFAIAATRAGAVLVPLPGAGGQAALAPRIDFFRQLVTEADGDAAISGPAQRLFDDLLAPVLAALPGDTATTLIISPDGPLHALPWDALSDRNRFVIDRWSVAVVPSYSVIASRPASSTGAGTLVVAVPDAVPGLGPLPGAETETAVIRRRLGADLTSLIGPASTKQAVTQALDRYAILHFASHAVVDHAMPLRSHLVLAGGDWRAEEIYRTKLTADLVVLSACETGIGTPTDGEGVMSLARAFLHAGARSTIATLWPVADQTGPTLADAFYRSLAHGDPVVTAATLAKRELREAGARPVEWAGYIVTTSPSTTARATPGDLSTDDKRPSPLWSAAIAVLAVIAGFVLRKRLAVAAVAGALVAITTLGVIVRPETRAPPTISRGTSAAITATAQAGVVRWSPLAHTSYHVAFYDPTGGVLPAPPAGAGSATAPTSAAWAVVTADRDGVPAGTPALVRLVP